MKFPRKKIATIFEDGWMDGCLVLSRCLVWAKNLWSYTNDCKKDFSHFLAEGQRNKVFKLPLAHLVWGDEREEKYLNSHFKEKSVASSWQEQVIYSLQQGKQLGENYNFQNI